MTNVLDAPRLVLEAMANRPVTLGEVVAILGMPPADTAMVIVRMASEGTIVPTMVNGVPAVAKAP